ncbi:MAG: hypothetical protein ABIG61_06155 [Planctomycetota bacterium]
MKKAKSTEKLIRDIYKNKLQVTTNSDLDKRILANSMSKLDKVKNGNLANAQPNIWRMVTKSRIGQIAAVIILLLAIYLLTVNDRDGLEQHKTIVSQNVAIFETPAELVSAITLNMAFRDGGMPAMEKQFDKAEKKVKPGLKTSLTVEQLICELNGC